MRCDESAVGGAECRSHGPRDPRTLQTSRNLRRVTIYYRILHSGGEECGTDRRDRRHPSDTMCAGPTRTRCAPTRRGNSFARTGHQGHLPRDPAEHVRYHATSAAPTSHRPASASSPSVHPVDRARTRRPDGPRLAPAVPRNSSGVTNPESTPPDARLRDSRGRPAAPARRPRTRPPLPRRTDVRHERPACHHDHRSWASWR